MRIKLSPDQSLVSGRQAVMAYCRLLESIDSPVALSCYLQVKYHAWDDLVNRKINPVDYNCAESFRKDYQAVKTLQKASFLETTIDRREAAVARFIQAEEACRQTNERFDDLMYGAGLSQLGLDDPEVLRTLLRARNQISRILGPVPKEIKNARFGPGVTSFVKRDVTLPQKYSREIHVTPELYPYWRDVVGPLWGSEVKNVELVSGNAVSFVPKNAKTDRAIAVEPHLNVYLQLGLGQILRDRLRPWIDLARGQDVNRFLASKAHDWDLATVDLESASDTISRSLVWFLLPEEWATLLDTARSHRYTLNGEQHEAEKFSSMGNGFTFELETIIFYSIALASGSHRAFTSCYGDDIIIDRSCFPLLERTLQFAGFTINGTKTFTRGSFFESCGEDYFDGINVRPFQWAVLNPLTLFKMMNDVSEFSRVGAYRNKRYQGLYNLLFSWLPEELRKCRIPKGYGHVGVVSSWDEVCPAVLRHPDGWCGFRTKALKFRSRTFGHGEDVGGYLSSLDTMTETSKAPVKGRGKFQIGDLNTFGCWDGPGPWAVLQ